MVPSQPRVSRQDAKTQSAQTKGRPDAQSNWRPGLFRHFVCRVGGLPTGLLEGLQATSSAALVDELLQTEEERRAGREPITKALYESIGECSDRKVRGALVQLKRDIHNLRLPRTAQLEKARPALNRGLGEEIERMRRLGLRCQELEGEFEKAHRRELAEIRRQFQDAVTHPDLQKGLLLSSRSLFRQVKRYSAAPVDKLNKKDRQAERSLMRYFSRTAMKATPFSTFCAVIAGRLAEDGQQQGTFQGDPGRKTSLIRLNKSLYPHLLARLLRHPETRKHFHVELNPTLRDEEGKLLFLTALGDREVFQRMPKSPVVELLSSLFQKTPHRPLSALLEALCTNPQVEATAEEADAFVSRLLEIGLIRFRIGIREQEVDWDRPLCQILGRIPTEQAEQASQLLQTLRRNALDYAAASVAARRKLLEESVSLVEDGLKELDPSPPETSGRDAEAQRKAEEDEQEGEEGHQGEEEEEEQNKEGELPLPRSAVRMRTEIPFFEDAGADSCLPVSPERLQGAADCLVEYVQLASRLAQPRSSMATMRRFFDNFYKHGRSSVPLLEFYEDFYREHFKEHLERMQRSGRPLPQAREEEEAKEEGQEKFEDEPQELAVDEDPQGEGENKAGDGYNLANPLQVDLIDQITGANKALRRLVEKRWKEAPDAAAIDLSRADLEEALKEVPAALTGCNSVSVFAQHLPGFGEDGGDGLVANTFLAGFGKYFSRFLGLFPSSVEKGLFDENSRLSSQWLAEICGDAGFNANLHPPLLRWEISYPTGETGPSEIQISTADLQVEPHPGDPHALLLRHSSSKKQVIPVDLGFLNPRMRPPLFQLLSRFTPPTAFSFPLPESIPLRQEQEGEGEGVSSQGEEEPAAGDQPPPSPLKVSTRPRITYRGRLVLARRRWQIPGELYPRRHPGQSEQSYFLAVNRWRQEQGFPRQVFVRVHPQPAPPKPAPPKEADADKEESSQKEKGTSKDQANGQAAETERPETGKDAPKTPPGPAPPRMRRHHYKPQFIDFRNPLLVELFGKVAENLESFRVTLEERLPDRRHLPARGDNRYATEFILQVNFKEVSRQEAKSAKY